MITQYILNIDIIFQYPEKKIETREVLTMNRNIVSSVFHSYMLLHHFLYHWQLPDSTAFSFIEQDESNVTFSERTSVCHSFKSLISKNFL